MKLLCWMAGLVAALALPAAGWAGDQTYISWTLGEQGRKPSVTWEITGSTKWYVAVVQIATQRRVDERGDFLPENLVAYDVLDPSESSGRWTGPARLPAGRYFGRLKLRYDGPCQTNCQSTTSIRSFTIDPPPVRGLSWKATAGVGKVAVTWTKPRNGWYVSMVVVDDDRRFSSPEDGVAWAGPATTARWTSGPLGRGTYYVRLRARHVTCASCVWTAPAKTVRIERANAAPELRPVKFEITRRDHRTRRHSWRATFTVCDPDGGRLRAELVEATGAAGGAVEKRRRTIQELPAPHGCRSYAVAKRSAFPFASGTFVRVSLRVRDGLGAWSARTRKVTWVTTA